MAASPLAAFAIVAGYQFIMFVVSEYDSVKHSIWLTELQLYLSTYLLIFTFGKVLEASRLTTITHLTTSILAPVTSVVSRNRPTITVYSLLKKGLGSCDAGVDQPVFTALQRTRRYLYGIPDVHQQIRWPNSLSDRKRIHPPRYTGLGRFWHSQTSITTKASLGFE